MYDFNKHLVWKLRRGSHDAPGDKGGTCINEAAVLASGFEYREVSDADDLPECFSRLICQYLLRMNDGMPANLRQAYLMPFVNRLAGTTDTVEIERARAILLLRRIGRELVPAALDAIDKPKLAARCRKAKSLPDVISAMESVSGNMKVRETAVYLDNVVLKLATLEPGGAMTEDNIHALMDIASCLATSVIDIAKWSCRPKGIYRLSMLIVAEAIALTSHEQEQTVPEVVVERLKKAQAPAAEEEFALT